MRQGGIKPLPAATPARGSRHTWLGESPLQTRPTPACHRHLSPACTRVGYGTLGPVRVVAARVSYRCPSEPPLPSLRRRLRPACADGARRVEHAPGLLVRRPAEAPGQVVGAGRPRGEPGTRGPSPVRRGNALLRILDKSPGIAFTASTGNGRRPAARPQFSDHPRQAFGPTVMCWRGSPAGRGKRIVQSQGFNYVTGVHVF